jgi:hypothetical protein
MIRCRKFSLSENFRNAFGAFILSDLPAERITQEAFVARINDPMVFFVIKFYPFQNTK